MIKAIRGMDKIIVRCESFFTMLLLTVMIIFSFLQVILRNFFDTSIIWADILLRQLVLWITFMGAAIATSRSRHIRIDVINRFLPGTSKKAVEIIVNITAIFVCIILAKASYQFVLSEKEFGDILFLKVPSWTFQIALPLGFTLISLQFLIRTILSFTDSQKKS